MVTLIETKESLIDLWKESNKACNSARKISNLILSGFFPFSEISTEWINSYKDKAKDMQAPQKPNNLVLNHGEYIDKYKSKFNKSGLEYITEELKTKADSNRACWSLFDMSTLIDSGDKSIPSFMVLQAGISTDKRTLSLTSYYRAIEVSQFLPINLAESCLVAEYFQKKFSFQFKSINITLHAFNAYIKENFACLEKAKIDMLTEGEIMMAVMTAKTSRIWMRELLADKRETIESHVEITGLTLLLKCIKMYNSKDKDATSIVYDTGLVKLIESIIAHIDDYNVILYTSTYASAGKTKYLEIVEEMDKAIKLV